ncbi:MAG TPA: hypothetical protein VFD97_04155 [Acidimicrobiia bacterium]|nr:hypothetical protein [Acidimicrobiia bacterium]
MEPEIGLPLPPNVTIRTMEDDPTIGEPPAWRRGFPDCVGSFGSCLGL